MKVRNMNNDNIAVYLLIGLAVLLFVVPAIGMLTKFIFRCSQDLRYLNGEIARSAGREREHWIRRRRKLWRSLLPFRRRK